MITANLYAAEELSPEADVGIRNGLDLIGQYVGGISVGRAIRVKLKSANGLVNPENIGYGKLDIRRHLHIFAAPLARGKEEEAGLALAGSGIAWVNSLYPSNTQRVIAAHEVSHALGFVISEAPQLDRSSPGHCVDATCVMHKTVMVIDDETAGIISQQRELEELLFGNVSEETRGFDLVGRDLCSPCKADMRDLAEEHIGRLQLARIATNQVTPLNHINS